LFFRSKNSESRPFTKRRAAQALALRAGNDSEMAPQATEIAQKGRGNPPARGR
jgi:hypothetical protein